MIPNDLRTEFITLLCSYPRLKTRAGRNVWLMNLPDAVRKLLVDRHDDCRLDLAFILDALRGQQLEDGQWPILILVDALLPDLSGLQIGQDLRVLRRRVNSLTEPPSGLGSEPAFEEIVIGEDERVPVKFLQDALRASKAVARIAVPRTIGGWSFGTGWLVAPGLLMTCHHVVEARKEHEPPAEDGEVQQQAKGSLLRFGYDSGSSYAEYASLELEYADDSLDYAVLRVADCSFDGQPLADWGILGLVRIQPRLVRGVRLNVIQHPGGRAKEIALRTNFYLGPTASATLIHYLSDTEGGSSGSPVLNDRWQALGLHHGWDRYNNHYGGQPVRFNSLGLQCAVPSQFSDQPVAAINEATVIHAILDDLPAHLRREIELGQGWS